MIKLGMHASKLFPGDLVTYVPIYDVENTALLLTKEPGPSTGDNFIVGHLTTTTVGVVIAMTSYSRPHYQEEALVMTADCIGWNLARSMKKL